MHPRPEPSLPQPLVPHGAGGPRHGAPGPHGPQPAPRRLPSRGLAPVLRGTVLRGMVVLGMVVLGMVLLAACARRPARSAAPAPGHGLSLEGSYELAWRELPDGRVVRPPEVLGAMDITATRRNLNVSWLKDGERHALALVTAWRIEGGRLHETSVYRLTDFAGQGVAYRTEPVSGSSPVELEPGVLRVQMPLDGEPEVEVRADGLTSRKPGAFVDHWRRVR